METQTEASGLSLAVHEVKFSPAPRPFFMGKGKAADTYFDCLTSVKINYSLKSPKNRIFASLL